MENTSLGYRIAQGLFTILSMVGVALVAAALSPEFAELLKHFGVSLPVVAFISVVVQEIAKQIKNAQKIASAKREAVGSTYYRGIDLY